MILYQTVYLSSDIRDVCLYTYISTCGRRIYNDLVLLVLLHLISYTS